MPSKIDFYGLARPIQDRFAAATRRKAHPAPLLAVPASRARAWGVLAGAVGLTVLEAVLLSAGFGQRQSGLAIHSAVVIGLDVLVLAAAAYCVLHAIGILVTYETRPWRPGLYLFPGCVVDAREPLFQVWSMSDAAAIERVASPAPGLALRTRDGSRVVVAAPSGAVAERAEAALEPLRRELERAIESGDPHVLAELDPLHDLAMSSPIGPTERMRPNLALWVRLDWAFAIVVGVVLGYALASTRNTLSDHAMYRAVLADGTVAAYREYLTRGTGHVADVRDILLPRAELREAEAAGNVEAMQAFVREHPSTGIAPEVDAAMKRAMLAELERAKQAGTVTALDAFASRYPNHGVEAELHAARHALFVRALAAWRAKAHPDAGTNAFFERLLAAAEKGGKPGEVRFRGKPSTSMDDADKSVVKSGHYPGPDALPSHYVNPDALRPREQRVADAVAAAFGAAFPSDILSVHAAPTLGPDEAAPAGAPELVVEYSPEWSHGNNANVKPNTVFAGLIFTFDSTFSLPEGAPWKLSVRTWRAAESWKIKSEGMSREDFEQKVYDGMLDGMFDQLQHRLVDVLF